MYQPCSLGRRQRTFSERARRCASSTFQATLFSTVRKEITASRTHLRPPHCTARISGRWKISSATSAPTLASSDQVIFTVFRREHLISGSHMYVDTFYPVRPSTTPKICSRVRWRSRWLERLLPNWHSQITPERFTSAGRERASTPYYRDAMTTLGVPIKTLYANRLPADAPIPKDTSLDATLMTRLTGVPVLSVREAFASGLHR